MTHKSDWITEPGTPLRTATFNKPKYTWVLKIGTMSFYHRDTDPIPNAFQRRMQEMLLGFKWERLGDDS